MAATYLRPFRPRLFDAFTKLSRTTLRADVLSGITVAVVALPLAMAFAIASGLPPQAGLFTAIVAGFLISALGGTRTSIGGPTGAYVVILLSIVEQYGPTNLAIATCMAGIMLFLMGVLGMGQIIRFFPTPIITGFTNGIAILILLTQLKDFFGLPVASLPSHFTALVPVLLTLLPSLDHTTFALSLGCLILILAWPKRLNEYLPAPFVALVGGTLIVLLLHLPLPTIGSRFGGIPQGLPPFTPLKFDWAQFTNLLSPAFKIALLGAIESLLCAVVADHATNDQHDSDQELMAQGIANFVSPLMGGMAATAAIARTATNIHNGGTTPIAGIAHAVALLLMVIVAAPLAAYVPLPVLAAILVSVSVKMGDWDIRKALYYPKRDTAVLILTFALTVVFDLTIAIEIGMLLAAAAFIHRMADQTQLNRLADGHMHIADRNAVIGKTIPHATMVFRIEGALFFGSTDKLNVILQATNPDVVAVIVQLHRVTLIDTSGLLALEELAHKLEDHGQTLILCSAEGANAEILKQARLPEKIGMDNVQPDLDAAFDRARAVFSVPPDDELI